MPENTGGKSILQSDLEQQSKSASEAQSESINLLKSSAQRMHELFMTTLEVQDIETRVKLATKCSSELYKMMRLNWDIKREASKDLFK